jgi:tRNA 2-thiocytidine biosynthesis protein TtcA
MIDYRSSLAVKVRKQMVESIAQYQLIVEGDRVMVCVSGGKDSSVLLAILSESQRRAPFDFDIAAVLLDQKQPGFDGRVYKKWVETEIGVPLIVLEQDTYSIVKEKTVNRVYCSLCSRLRRGILYDHAFKSGFTKMALGHHREDAAETLLLNLFYTGKLQAMPPKFQSDDGRNIVIRPFFTVAESDLVDLSESWKIPTIPCNLCGSQEEMKRKEMKKLISNLEKTIPEIRYSMATAITNIRSSHLADDKIWDFRGLSAPKT